MEPVPSPSARALGLASAAALAAALLGAGAMAGQAVRNQRLVNENQHRTEQAPSGWECTGTPPSQETEAPPLSYLGDNPLLGAHSYHVATDLHEGKARCYYDPNLRPKILSSDMKDVLPSTAKEWMLRVQSHHGIGQIHFEHFDACLSWYAVAGNSISNEDSFPPLSWCQDHPRILDNWDAAPRTVLGWFESQFGTNVNERRLRQNGLLFRPYSDIENETRKLRWVANLDGTLNFENQAKRLMGYGFMGALSAGDARLDIGAYLAALRKFNVNFTRVWAMELWTGLANPSSEGVEPFAQVGSSQPETDLYDLGFDSPAFYDRLRRFVQGAADRGIVVQLSVFDKHGLICDDDPGQYRDSPYRDLNNIPAQDYMENITCSCSGSDGISEPPDAVTVCYPLDTFIDENHAIATVHRRFLSRVGEEAGGVGSVIFEIINEAMAPYQDSQSHWHDGDWAVAQSAHPYPNETWQGWVLESLRLSLPLESTATEKHVVRDAFNGADDDSWLSLHGKASDVDGATWTANNVQVVTPSGATEQGGFPPDRTMGYATSNGEANKSSMSASLPFSSTSTWTKIQVRADFTVDSGQAKIGFSSSWGNSIWVMLDVPSSQIKLQQAGGCPILAPVCTLGTATILHPTWRHNVRLKVEQDVNPANWHVSVYLDAVPVTGLQGIATGSIGTVVASTLGGSNGSTPYPVDAAQIDNFEAARFCDDKNRGCTP